MAVNLSPYGGVGAQFLDNAGNVLTGGKIETYAAGTTVPQATYTSSTGVTFHPNPIILDASGRVPSGGEIWLTDGLLYKFVLRDSNNVLIATYDNISGINSNFVNFTSQQEIQTATAGQTVFTLTTVNYTPGTNSLSVFVDGVNQYGPGALYAYLETNSTTVTFVNGLHVGASVKFTTAAALTGTATNANVVIYDPAGVGAVSTTVQAKLRETVSVKDFGAVGDGVTDDHLAIATALDSLTNNGGVLEFENGKTYYVSQPIIIPYSSNQSRYLRLQGNGSILKGTLSTNIIETGQSTTSVGGVSNWDTTPETFLHGNLHISGFVFETYNVAIRFYNAVFNSSVTDNFFKVGKTAIQAKRSFYCTISGNTIRNGYAGKPDTEAAVILETFVNIIYFNDNHISGIASGVRTGTGVSVSGGAFAFTLAECGIEGCKVGLTLSGEDNPVDVTGCYFEANDKSIVHAGGTLRGTVSGNWFFDAITFESTASPAWRFVNNTNFNNGTISAAVATSSITWDQGDLTVSQTNVLSNLVRPAFQDFSIMSKQFTAGERIVFDPAVGFNGAAAKSTVQYQDMLMPFNYFGDIFREVSVPFCELSINGGATEIYFDTRIQYRAGRLGGIEYDLTVNDFAGSTVTAGRVLNNGTVVPYDSTGKTVTISDNGGYVRITISAFDFSTGFSATGRIRVV
jgi:hypothetical protein